MVAPVLGQLEVQEMHAMKPQPPSVEYICDCGCTDGRHRELMVGLWAIAIIVIIMVLVVLWVVMVHELQA